MPEIIDLSHTYDPEVPGVSWEPAKTLDKDGWNARWLRFYSHAGTHMDAPLHFGVSSRTIDQIPLSECIGKAWLADVQAESRSLIYLTDLGQLIDQVMPGDSLILRTGWSQYFKTSKYRDELPRISQELALWMVDRKIKMVGVEPPSVADVNNREEVTLIHQILLGGNIIIIEGLTNLDKIQSNPFTFMAFPLKVKDGDGSPARAMAWENLNE